MAKGNMAVCLAITLVHEGGYANHPKDPGGVTLQGVIQRTYDSYRRSKSKPTRPLTKAMMSTAEWARERDQIYREMYWAPVAAERLPFGVDLSVFDFGVNSGVGRAPKYLQAALGLQQTGKMDDTTVAAAVKADGKDLIQKINARRLSFLQGLAIWNTFKRGWSSRVADIEAQSVAMWLRATSATKKAAAKVLGEEGQKANRSANEQDGAAAATTGGSGGAAISFDVDWWVLAGGGVVVALIVVGLISRARHNKQRAKAYAAAAKAAGKR